MRRIAERTSGFSGADLANVINEGAILAARRNKKTIGPNELFESIEKVILGPERKSKRIDEDEKKIIAYHEAGHALIGDTLENADPVQKVSVVSRGTAGGYTLSAPQKDKRLLSKNYFTDELSVLLGGYIAEKLNFGEVTTGASNDLERATQMARNMVTRYGMSELGPRTFGHKEELVFLGKEIQEEKNYSEKTAEAIDEQVSSFIHKAYQVAEDILKDKKEVLERLVKELMEKETLEKEEFDVIVGKILPTDNSK